MTPSELLAAFLRRGVVLYAEGDKVKFRGPKGAVTPELRQAVVGQRAGLLELLAARPGWDPAHAARVLASADARCDRALVEDAKTVAQRSVVEVFRRVVRNHAEKRDLLLWEAMEFLEESFACWRNAP